MFPSRSWASSTASGTKLNCHSLFTECICRRLLLHELKRKEGGLKSTSAHARQSPNARHTSKLYLNSKVQTLPTTHRRLSLVHYAQFKPLRGTSDRKYGLIHPVRSFGIDTGRGRRVHCPFTEAYRFPSHSTEQGNRGGGGGGCIAIGIAFCRPLFSNAL